MLDSVLLRTNKGKYTPDEAFIFSSGKEKIYSSEYRMHIESIYHAPGRVFFPHINDLFGKVCEGAPLVQCFIQRVWGGGGDFPPKTFKFPPP